MSTGRMSDPYRNTDTPEWDPDEREPEDDAVYDPGHECRDHEEEQSTQPTRAGAFSTWTECGLCGRQLSPTRRDSLL